jgi:hypothetical protein
VGVGLFDVLDHLELEEGGAAGHRAGYFAAR